MNKVDRERADFAGPWKISKKNFTDKTVLVIQMPMGAEENFKGVIDLLSMKAYAYKNDVSGSFIITDIPAGISR